MKLDLVLGVLLVTVASVAAFTGTAPVEALSDYYCDYSQDNVCSTATAGCTAGAYDSCKSNTGSTCIVGTYCGTQTATQNACTKGCP